LSYSINLLNIKKVVLGGGVSQDFELLREGIDASLDKYSFKQANKSITVEKTHLGYNAALIGAAAVAINKITE
jgi:predicted NBD/HSP70 family sugar kinase